MSTQTEHLKLDLREAADIFNPLSTNANFESLDSIIYEIQTKGGVPTYTTTASANLLKLSQNPTPNVTVFKFVAAGDANTWSYQETVNDIVALDGSKKTVKGGEMYVAWVNAANAMVVIAWPDVVNAQTFDGKGPAEWASKAQLDAVNQTAANATTTAQAAVTVANSMKVKNSVVTYQRNITVTPGDFVTITTNLDGAFCFALSITGGNDAIGVGTLSTYEAEYFVANGFTQKDSIYASNHVPVRVEFGVSLTTITLYSIKKFVDGAWTDCTGAFTVRVVAFNQ